MHVKILLHISTTTEKHRQVAKEHAYADELGQALISAFSDFFIIIVGTIYTEEISH